jgi:hypothetical protein
MLLEWLNGWLYGHSFFVIHGWVLWAIWGLFALVQIGSTRYLKGQYPRSYMTIHIISGTFVTVATVFFSVWA